MTIVKTKAFKELTKTIKLGQEIHTIDTMIKFLEKRRKKLLKRMGIDSGVGTS